jgi:hypothetical protein
LPIEPLRTGLWTIQAIVIVLTLLLAIPTGSMMVDARPKRYMPGLIEGDDDELYADPLAGDLDDEQN